MLQFEPALCNHSEKEPLSGLRLYSNLDPELVDLVPKSRHLILAVLSIEHCSTVVRLACLSCEGNSAYVEEGDKAFADGT